VVIPRVPSGSCVEPVLYPAKMAGPLCVFLPGGLARWNCSFCLYSASKEFNSDLTGRKSFGPGLGSPTSRSGLFPAI